MLVSHDYTLEEVYNLAKHTRKCISCEWQNCPGPSLLNSWYSFEKHILQHCYSSSNDHGQHVCQYRACSARLYASEAELLTHVRHSHFTRIPMLCPIGDCTWTFHRFTQLESHLEEDHEEDYDNETGLLRVHHATLKPSCKPFKPSFTILQPLDSVKHIPVWDLMPFPIRLSPHRSHPNMTAGQSQASSSQHCAWGYINNLRAEEQDEKEEEDKPPMPLSLRPTGFEELTSAGAALTVRRKPPEENLDPTQMCLSRPVLIPATPVVPKLPPRTIGFEVHKQNALKAAKLPLDWGSESPPPQTTFGRQSRESSENSKQSRSRTRAF